MQHERDFDKDHPMGEVKTLDDICREAGQRDRIDFAEMKPYEQQLAKRDLEEATKLPEVSKFVDAFNRKSPIPVYPPHYNPFVDMLRRAGDFAAKMSRSITGHPKRKPFPSDKFKI